MVEQSTYGSPPSNPAYLRESKEQQGLSLKCSAWNNQHLMRTLNMQLNWLTFNLIMKKIPLHKFVVGVMEWSDGMEWWGVARIKQFFWQKVIATKILE